MNLPEPIKAIGEHTVPLKVHREVTVTLEVRVVKEGGNTPATASTRSVWLPWPR